MRKSTKVVSFTLTGILAAAGASLALLTINGSDVRAQAPISPCNCSRVTAIAGADEMTGVPAPLQSRFGMVHCQCGAATCVSQFSFASVGASQLYCVK